MDCKEKSQLWKFRSCFYWYFIFYFIYFGMLYVIKLISCDIIWIIETQIFENLNCKSILTNKWHQNKNNNFFFFEWTMIAIYDSTLFILDFVNYLLNYRTWIIYFIDLILKINIGIYKNILNFKTSKIIISWTFIENKVNIQPYLKFL